MLKTVCVVALLTMASPTLAQAGDNDASPAAKPKKEKQICRRGASTGTRLPGPSECHTQAVWAEIDAANYKQNKALIDNQRSLERTVAREGPK